MSGRRKRRAKTQRVKAKKKGLIFRLPAKHHPGSRYYETPSPDYKAFEELGRKMAEDIERKILGVCT